MTKNLDSRIFAELDYFLDFLSKEEKNKIPEKLLKLIQTKKGSDFYFDEDSFEDNLLDETRQWISLIYTDYLASDEERKIILAKEKMVANNPSPNAKTKNSLEELNLSKKNYPQKEIEKSMIIVDTDKSHMHWWKKIKIFIQKIRKR